MWVRDHARPEFHKALGVDIAWYDQEVFRKTSTIARQIFPIEIDIDHPALDPEPGADEPAPSSRWTRRSKQGGVAGKLAGWAASARALRWPSSASTPSRSIRHELPADVRLEPSY